MAVYKREPIDAPNQESAIANHDYFAPTAHVTIRKEEFSALIEAKTKLRCLCAYLRENEYSTWLRASAVAMPEIAEEAERRSKWESQ
ncbi:MAG: hypothetical protein Q4B15_07910 [Lachnospiraceae bacterium]|nr:hypothetical protein [Lachnospiraceae bacterium]